MRNFFTTIFVISTLVILGFSSNIFADESIESLGNAGQSSSSQRQIDEIIVTSRKIEENIQQVPVAVYAVDEKALDDFRPTTMRDMDSLAPNLQIGINSASGNQGAIFVRGCGYAEVEKTQNPPVGLIVDGLFMGTNTGTLLDAFDWSKVQVNSGPQGVVYGKNTSCGNLIVERNRPSRDFEFDTEISIGDYDHHEFGIIMNIPLSENVSSRWNFRKLGHEGYYNNLLHR
ncbi:MAG: TonB-dependent receptor plug domain-containing protein [Alphaproteobacteria bacterium]